MATGKFYADVAARADEVTVLDGYRGVEEVLATQRVRVLKINRSELQQIIAAVTTDDSQTPVSVRRVGMAGVLFLFLFCVASKRGYDRHPPY